MKMKGSVLGLIAVSFQRNYTLSGDIRDPRQTSSITCTRPSDCPRGSLRNSSSWFDIFKKTLESPKGPRAHRVRLRRTLQRACSARPLSIFMQRARVMSIDWFYVQARGCASTAPAFRRWPSRGRRRDMFSTSIGHWRVRSPRAGIRPCLGPVQSYVPPPTCVSRSRAGTGFQHMVVFSVCANV